MSRPLIGITTPQRFFHLAYYFIRLSVFVCGGKSVPLKNINSLEKYNLDGLVIGGGTDVFPGLYQNDPKQDYHYDRERDEMEMAWLRKAELENIPVLGICRGAQMMNVVHGGSLHLDVSLVYEDAEYPKALWRQLFFRKTIFAQESSLLQTLTKKTQMRVNSMHTQSIDDLGDNLEVVARERNGIVQAIERKTPHNYYLGVQFHPEFLIGRKDMRSIFKGLVDTAKDRKKAANKAQPTFS
jgi:putative glutamine amidotransferase